MFNCSHVKAQRKRKKRSYGWNNNDESFGSEKSACRARYQQSPVEVYAKFLAKDQVSWILYYNKDINSVKFPFYF